MKLKLLIIGLALLASASPSYAGGIMMMGGGVGATVSNGEVGNKSGANDDSISPTTYPGNDQALTSCYVASASGSISYIHAYLPFSSGTTGQQYNAGLYDSSGNLIADGALVSEGTVPGITTVTLDSAQTITAGTTYCISFGAHNSPDSYSISATTASGVNVFYDSTFTVGATLPDTVDITTVKSNNVRLRLWATNTANGS